MRIKLTIIYLFLTHFLYAQNLNEFSKDSIKALVCEMVKNDQEVRASWHKAINEKDSTDMSEISSRWRKIDSTNFINLSNIIRTVGFPCPQLLGKGTCYPFVILIHWFKNQPLVFCSNEMIKVIKKEIDNGHLPLCQIDFCFFSYVSYMKADKNIYDNINRARVAYGLRPYSYKEYIGEVAIEPLMNDSETEKKKHKLPIMKHQLRNSEP